MTYSTVYTLKNFKSGRKAWKERLELGAQLGSRSGRPHLQNTPPPTSHHRPSPSVLTWPVKRPLALAGPSCQSQAAQASALL